MDFILDCSVTLAWFLEDEATSSTDRIQDSLALNSEACVPALWVFEVGNAFWVAERRRRIRKEKIDLFMEQLKRLPIRIEPPPTFGVLNSMMEIARKYRLSGYDASYLELAIRNGLPLATLDRDLVRAAKKTNISLLL